MSKNVYANKKKTNALLIPIILMMGFGKHLITNTSFWGNLDSLNFNMAEGTSYTTLYNPNFLSFYFGMLIPLLACLFIGAKKVWQRAALVVAEILCIICLKGSGSDSGWMAVAAGAAIAVLVLLSRGKKLRYVGGALVVAGIIGSIVIANTTSFGERIKNTITGTYHIQKLTGRIGLERRADHSKSGYL